MSKQSLISELSAQRDAILQFCDALTEEQRAVSLTPEGWRVQEFIGHLSHWEQFTLDCIRDILKLGRPTPLPLDAYDDDANIRAAAQRQDWNWQRVRREFENTRNAVIQRVTDLSDNDLQFYSPTAWVHDTRVITVETLIREEVLSHGQEHLTQLQKHEWHNHP